MYEPSPQDRHGIPLQEELSVRQAKRAAKAEERRKKSEALKEEVDLLCS